MVDRLEEGMAPGGSCSAGNRDGESPPEEEDEDRIWESPSGSGGGKVALAFQFGSNDGVFGLTRHSDREMTQGIIQIR